MTIPDPAASSLPRADTPAAPAPPTLSVPWKRVDRFLGQFTHDVRNGLNALELQLTLLGEISQEADVREEVRNLRAGVAAIGRELQAVRTAAAPVSPQRLPYPVADLLEDLRARLRRRHAEATDALRFDVAPDAVRATVEVDPELVFDAVGRLFDNAIHFRETPGVPLGLNAALATNDAGARVLRLCLTEGNKDAPDAVELADWGGHPLHTTRRGAHVYGLGLFRARRITEAHGGGLRARYDGAARRLEVSLDFPLPVPPPGGADAADRFPR